MGSESLAFAARTLLALLGKDKECYAVEASLALVGKSYETMLCAGSDNPAFWVPAAKTLLALVGKGG